MHLRTFTTVPALVLVGLLLVAPVHAGESAARKLAIEGFTKPVLVQVPAGYTPTKKWGLVLFLHGTGMNGEHVHQAFADSFQALGAAGYVLAFPSSNFTAWCAAEMPDADKSQEMRLLRKTIETLLAEYSIDDRCVHTWGFSCGTVLLAQVLGFRSEWDGLAIRSFCGNSGGLAGTVAPAQAARAKETAVWILNGEGDEPHAEVSRNIHEAFTRGGFESCYTVAWGIDHGYPLAPLAEMVCWWRELDGERLAHHPIPARPAVGFEVPMILPGSAAQRAGLRVGDRLLAADGKPLATTAEVSAALCGRKPGDKAVLELKRGGKKMKVAIDW